MTDPNPIDVPKHDPAAGARSSRRRWTTRDLLVVAAVAIVATVPIVPVTYGTLAIQATAPVAVIWTFGLWLVPGVLAFALTRRPGAVLLAMAMSGLVQAPVVPFGWGAVLFQLALAAPVEASLAVTRYRRTGPVALTVAGGVCGAVFLPAAWVPYDLGSLAIVAQAAVASSQVLSGALFALGAVWLGRRLARSGITVADGSETTA